MQFHAFLIPGGDEPVFSQGALKWWKREPYKECWEQWCGAGGFLPGQCEKTAWDKSAIDTSLKCSLFFVETALYFPKPSWNLLWFLKGHNRFTEPSLESSKEGLAFFPRAICVIDRPCAEPKSSYDQSLCALLTQRWLQLLHETQDSFRELILGPINMSMPSTWHWSGAHSSAPEFLSCKEDGIWGILTAFYVSFRGGLTCKVILNATNLIVEITSVWWGSWSQSVRKGITGTEKKGNMMMRDWALARFLGGHTKHSVCRLNGKGKGRGPRPLNYCLYNRSSAREGSRHC